MDFTKPQTFIKLPGDYDKLSFDEEQTLLLRFAGPEISSSSDYSKTCQYRCRRVEDLSRLKDIGFDNPIQDLLGHPTHPDIPYFRGLYSLFTDEGNEFLAIKTKTGGGELWYHDELYCALNDWQKRFDEKPELSYYPRNDDLRKMPQYVWDEGDPTGFNMHWFFFRTTNF